MNSWWDLGEWIGVSGSTLQYHLVKCPFCEEIGDFSWVFHAKKKNQGSQKTLNFDTLECGNCKGYVMALWSASTHGGAHGYKVLPYSLKPEKYPECWPKKIGKYWLQAKKNLLDKNWETAVMAARTALQLSLRDHEADGGNLKNEIDDLAKKGILPPMMQEWSNHIRTLGNSCTHPDLEQPPTDPRDANDIVRFLELLLEYLYSLPDQINKYRNRHEVTEMQT